MIFANLQKLSENRLAVHIEIRYNIYNTTSHR